MTVLIYVDTSKQVGDPDHLKADTAPTDDKGGDIRTIHGTTVATSRF